MSRLAASYLEPEPAAGRGDPTFTGEKPTCCKASHLAPRPLGRFLPKQKRFPREQRSGENPASGPREQLRNLKNAEPRTSLT